MTLFKSRNQQNIRQKLKEAVWPSMGWRRTFHYYRHRMFRSGDSTHKIVAALATGSMACWNPFLGTHVVQMVFFCWLWRLNPFIGFLGTMIGNPWTYPVMFVWDYRLGVWLCGLFGLAGFVALPDGMAFNHFMQEPMTFLAYLFAHPQKLLLPLTLGGYVCGFLCWPIVYAILYYPVNAARTAYRLQRRRRFRKRQARQAGGKDKTP